MAWARIASLSLSETCGPSLGPSVRCISFTVLEAPRFRDAPGVLLPWAQARGQRRLHFNDEYP